MTLKENAITVAIAILFTTFILVSVDAFYERPEYEDFCGKDVYERFPPLNPETSKNCSLEQNQEEIDCYNDEGFSDYEYNQEGCREFKECNYCQKDYENARKEYANFLFLILAPFGALAIILGVYYKIEFLGSGFMFAGIILMFYGTIQNFEDLNKFTRVFVIFLELLLVLFIAYKKIIPEKKK